MSKKCTLLKCLEQQAHRPDFCRWRICTRAQEVQSLETLCTSLETRLLSTPPIQVAFNYILFEYFCVTHLWLQPAPCASYITYMPLDTLPILALPCRPLWGLPLHGSFTMRSRLILDGVISCCRLHTKPHAVYTVSKGARSTGLRRRLPCARLCSRHHQARTPGLGPAGLKPACSACCARHQPRHARVCSLGACLLCSWPSARSALLCSAPRHR